MHTVHEIELTECELLGIVDWMGVKWKGGGLF